MLYQHRFRENQGSKITIIAQISDYLIKVQYTISVAVP